MEEEDEGELGPICLDILGEVGIGFPMNGKRNVFCNVWWGLNGDVGVKNGFGARNGR